MADVQDHKSDLLYVLKLEAATQASRRDRQSIRGARVTLYAPCESPWKRDIEKLREEFQAFKVQSQNQDKMQLQVLGMRWNWTHEKKVYPIKEGLGHRLFFQTGKNNIWPSRGAEVTDNERPHYKIHQITAVNGGDKRLYAIFEDITLFGLQTELESNQKILEKAKRSLSQRTEYIIPGLVAENIKFRFGLIDYLDPDSLKAGVLIASSAVDLSNSVIPVRIANISDRTRTIQEGKVKAACTPALV
ncbi:retrovirus-related Pol polyprotein from transposon 412 [Trichonephila clavipes]|nr:retrovirus-related Pol polyprotein from transposon 412 [Trichonephila clavipes]